MFTKINIQFGFVSQIFHLVKKYGSHIAVDDISFTVEKGQVYGFLGPNGAGKSTTMNMITGYIAPTSGEIMINGYDILKEPEEAKKSIGYLSEELLWGNICGGKFVLEWNALYWCGHLLFIRNRIFSFSDNAVNSKTKMERECKNN